MSLNQSFKYRKALLLSLLRSKLGIKSRVGQEINEHYFFIHIPKTSGTSFRFMLFQQFKQEHIFPNMVDLFNRENKYPRLKELSALNLDDFSKRIELFLGHYPYAIGRKIFKEPLPLRYLVFLREPVSRVVSHLHHLQREHYIDRKMSLLEILEKRKSELANLQTRWLCNDFKKTKELSSTKLLTQAKVNLENIDFIGLSEHFDLSLALANKTFGWNMGKSVNYNVAPKIDSPNATLLEHIEKICNLDIELYTYAVQLFNKRIAEGGLS
ncbi:MAG: hypothetical protein AAGA77_03155 [Bacteroidota bacterium]